MDKVKPIITEEQAVAIRRALDEAVKPIVEAATAMVKALGDAYAESARRVVAALEHRNDEGPPASRS